MSTTFADTTSAVPFIRAPRAEIQIPVRLVNQTIGGSIYVNYLPVTSSTAATRKAREAVTRVADRGIAANAEALIGAIETTLTRWAALGLDPGAVPELQVFLPEDGSILLEWGSPGYRVGFSLERNEAESGWYLVSTRELGQIGASGYMGHTAKDKLVQWLLDFIVTNS